MDTGGGSGGVKLGNKTGILLTQKNGQRNGGDSFNAVTVAAAAQLVNSLLVKSETHSLDGMSEVSFAAATTTTTATTTNKGQNKDLAAKAKLIDQSRSNTDINQDHEQNSQLVEDEKNAKIYTCARCPQIFNSSNLLRKHVSENHEKEYECCICSMNFNNRFAFLKHKYFHMNLVFKEERNDEKKYDNSIKFSCDQNENEKEIKKSSKNKIINEEKTESDVDLYDLNTLYKRCLMNRETLIDVNISMPSSNQIAIDSAKAKRLANGSMNIRKDESNALVKLIKQNSCCSICRKCISEKKKLVAHKKLCLLKLKKKNASGLEEISVSNDEEDDNDVEETDLVHDFLLVNTFAKKQKNQTH